MTSSMLINPLIKLTIFSSFLQFLHSSFLAIINYRGPCRKPTDPVFLLLKTHMRVGIAAGGCRTSYLRTLDEF